MSDVADYYMDAYEEYFDSLRDDVPPSQDLHRYWQVARSKKKQDVDSKKVGKWLIFVPVEWVDVVWSFIAKATIDGRLGISSKVATAKPTKYPNHTKVICVYTKSYTNKRDVFRVRKELRNMGFNKTLYYKTDEMTLAGKYSGPESWLYRD